MTPRDAQSPATQLQFLLMQSATARCVQVVAKLNIPELLGDTPKTADELAAAAGAHPKSLYRLMRFLTGFGIFLERPDHRFEMTPMAACLRSGPDSLLPLALWLDALSPAREQLLHSVRTGEGAFNKVFGMHMFDWNATHPEDAAVFNAAMASHATNNHNAIVAAYDFSPFERIVDVGAGHGALMAAILLANPRLKGVVYDMKHAFEGAKKKMVDAGLSARCEVVTGDFFESVPRGGDIYIMSHIMHDWDDQRCIKILKNIASAIVPTGKLLVLEMLIPDGNAFSVSKYMDMLMLITCPGGMERTEDEYRQLLRQGGFEVSRITPTKTAVSGVEGVLSGNR